MNIYVRAYLIALILLSQLCSCNNKQSNKRKDDTLYTTPKEEGTLHSKIILPMGYSPGQILDVFDKLPYNAFYEQPLFHELNKYILTTPFYMTEGVEHFYGNLDSIVRSKSRFIALKRIIDNDSVEINSNYTSAIFYRRLAWFWPDSLVPMHTLFVGKNHAVLYSALRNGRIKISHLHGKYAQIINRALSQKIGSNHELSSDSPPPQFYTIITKKASYNIIISQRQYIGYKYWNKEPEILRGLLYADSIQWVFNCNLN